MGCKVITDKEGHPVGFACSRGARHRPPCDVNGCNRESTWKCQYPVKRGGKPDVCGRLLCIDHRVYIEESRLSYCRPHARLHQKEQSG